MTVDFHLPKFCKLQRDVYNGLKNHKRVALKAGRRGMKTYTEISYMCEQLLLGKRILYALPAPEGLKDVFLETLDFLEPLGELILPNYSDRTISFSKGRIDFKTLKKGGIARGLKYDIVIIDEAQECESVAVDLKQIIEGAILPTFLTTNGQLVLSGTGRSRCYFTEVFNNWETSDWLTNPKEMKDYETVSMLIKDATKEYNEQGYYYYYYNDNTYRIKENGNIELKNPNPPFVKRWSSYENPYVIPEALEKMKSEMDEVSIRQEIYAEDVERGSTLFQQQNIRYIEFENIPKLDYKVIGVDLAISMKDNADYTAIVVMGKDVINDTYYVLDVVRKHLTFNDTLEMIKSVAELHSVQTVVVESTQYQASMVQELSRKSDLVVLKAFPETDKFKRAIPLNAIVERGRFFVSKSIGMEYTKEFTSFPLGKNDDMIDATVYAYRILRKTND